MSAVVDRISRLLATMSDDDEVTLRQASAILDYSYPTLHKYRKNGWIRAIKKGGRWMVTISELKRFHKEGNYDSSSDPDTQIPLSDAERRAQPMPIKHTADGIDLSELTPEQLARLGSEDVDHET